MLQALGGSTNALIHLAAVAGRLGIAIDYQAFDRLGHKTPLLVDLKPAGIDGARVEVRPRSISPASSKMA